MGVDVWLRSVFDYADEEQFDRVAGPGADVPLFPTVDAFIQAAAKMYDKPRATGGYYRESYPWMDMRGDLLGTLGLSWASILKTLPVGESGCCEMPPDHARHFLEELRMRPLSPAMIEERAAERDATPSKREVEEATETLRAR